MSPRVLKTERWNADELEIHCPTCEGINAHLDGPPTIVQGEEPETKDRPFREAAVRVQMRCEPKSHPFFLYVAEHKGTITVWLDRRDYIKRGQKKA